jgi:hypothetical protein
MTLVALVLGALLALPLYAGTKRQPPKSTAPVEQLNIQELTCHMLGVSVEEYATQREKGIPITDALMKLRTWIANAGHEAPIQALHERLLLSAYHDTWLTPVQARQQFETACVIQMRSQSTTSVDGPVR